jgi:signal transduction histidine kinase
MASLGELTAGIAHEIQNPLNFVNNFSDLNKELLAEMQEEMQKGNIEEAKAIAADLVVNEDKISYHGKRAESIVKGMLLHSGRSAGQKELTDVNALLAECLRLSYQGFRVSNQLFNVTLKMDLDNTMRAINIVPQDLSRVFLNLCNNAFYAVEEKAKKNQEGYEPAVTVSTIMIKDKVQITVRDNGTGIPQKIIDKIFQPFFTTKPTGHGVGLGLSLCFDIIKSYNGELKTDSKEGEYAAFMILLPMNT